LEVVHQDGSNLFHILIRLHFPGDQLTDGEEMKKYKKMKMKMRLCATFHNPM